MWGETYLRLFLEYALPSQLSPGNLGGTKPKEGIHYLVLTSAEFSDRIRQHPAFRRLAGMMEAEVVIPPGVPFDHPEHYRPFSACYAHGMAQAARQGAACLFITADQVWADGSLIHILSLAQSGKRVVMVGGPRLDSSTAAAEMGDWLAQGGLTRRRAVKLALDHLHPWDRSLIRDAENRGRPASFMYWPVEDEGLVMRCLHLHPVLVDPLDRYPEITLTIDRGDFVVRCCPHIEDLGVVTDSDQAMFFSLAPPERSSEFLDQEILGERRTIGWARTLGLNQYNLWYFSQPIRLHLSEMSPQWEGVESASARLASKLQEDMSRSGRMAFYRLLHRMYNFRGLGPHLSKRRRLFSMLKRAAGIRW